MTDSNHHNIEILRDAERRLDNLEHKNDVIVQQLAAIETLTPEFTSKIITIQSRQESIANDIAAIKAELSSKTSFIGGVVFAITAIWVLGKVVFEYVTSGFQN